MIETQIGIDEIFLARRTLAIGRDHFKLKRLAKGNHPRVMAGEGRLDLGCDPLTQALRFSGPDLLQEWEDQPAADPPGHSKASCQFGATRIKSAIDVDLLVNRRAVAAVGLRLLICGRLHRSQDLSGELAAADRVESKRRARRDKSLRQVLHESM